MIYRLGTVALLLGDISAFQSSLHVLPLPSLKYTHQQATSRTQDMDTNPFIRFFSNLLSTPQQPTHVTINPVESMIQAYNNRDLDTFITYFHQDCEYEDTMFPRPFIGKEEIQRELRLQASSMPYQIIVDNIAVANNKTAILYHLEDTDKGTVIADTRHCAFYTLEQNLITSVFVTVEPTSKKGPDNLAVLTIASKILSKPRNDVVALPSLGSTPPERYFDAWNRRDMDAAIDVFTDDVTYDDTVFPLPLSGKDALKMHLFTCADAFPDSFTFVVDDIANGGSNIGVKWHVENNGKALPFTRGCSFYQLADNGLIREGIDIVEPAVLKLGAVQQFRKSLTYKISLEPIRIIPLIIWAAYMYIVFFSDGILPGANVLQLEQRTWEEVRDLSLNFFFVSPILSLPFSPVVHPMLEGVFNILLAWAALFSGFLSDDRVRKPNLVPFLPTVIGMQFLTSAFLLPYLATRTTEIETKVSLQELEIPVVESPLLGPFLGGLGVTALAWSSLARVDDFGGWSERVTSFWQLMSIDRVGSSFLVDLAIFAVFQGWLVDDDLKRRGVAEGELGPLRSVAKFVPFFGMAAYMTLRPKYASQDEE